jgi:hypothetical protein
MQNSFPPRLETSNKTEPFPLFIPGLQEIEVGENSTSPCALRGAFVEVDDRAIV